MARRNKLELSEAFLQANRARLDAIGPWTVTTDADNLNINWRQPAALSADWVPCDLQFHTDADSASIDPDEQMFELWELFRSRQSKFISQLRNLTDQVKPEMGTVTRAQVRVFREGHSGDDGEDYYSIDVIFIFDRDDEHSCFASYDPETGSFGSLQG